MARPIAPAAANGRRNARFPDDQRAMARARALAAALLCALAAPAALAQGGQDPVEAVWWHRITRQADFVQELVELVSIPNVASDRENIRRNAVHLEGMLERRGFSAEVLETDGNPLVWGELSVPGAKRTVLVYCHYDGQPVDPPRWAQADPWKPVLRAGRLEDGAQEVTDVAGRTTFGEDWRLYARSAADDKAPIVAFLSALDALKAAGLSPTSNLRVVLDGEEEAGSPSLVPAIARYRDRLSADLMLILDGPQHPGGKPTLVFGARGILTAELTVYGPKVGVHSGNYGNWVPNPALSLAHLLASMKDQEGRVLVAGFYDRVPPLSEEERALLAAVPDTAETLRTAFGIAGPERPGESLQEALQRPTLNIRGLASAHVGPGVRTIIPDRAIAELDLRLVAETPADDLAAKLRAHVEGRGYHLVDADPDDATRARYPRIARLEFSRATAAFRASPTSPEGASLRAALTRFWEEPPVVIRTTGGTVPIAPFVEALGFPAILIPTVNFDNHQHEENENLRVGNLFDGIITVAAALTME